MIIKGFTGIENSMNNSYLKSHLTFDPVFCLYDTVMNNNICITKCRKFEIHYYLSSRPVFGGEHNCIKISEAVPTYLHNYDDCFDKGAISLFFPLF